MIIVGLSFVLLSLVAINLIRREIKLNKIIEKIKTFMTEHDITEFDYSEYTKTLKELLKEK